MVLTVLKTSITKSKPQKITYRDYKIFDSVRFNDELKYVLAKKKVMPCTKFDEIFLRMLYKHAPIKIKLLLANHASYISRPLRKAVMKGPTSKILFQKTYRPLLKKLQKIKKLLQQALQKREKNFFNKLNTSFVPDNKLFWKNVKPFFPNKGSHRGNIKLVEGDKLFQDDSEVAQN